MQLQGLMFMLLIAVFIPILMIFSNHNVFFILTAILLLSTSIKNLYRTAVCPDDRQHGAEDDMSEELESTLNLDIKRFGVGIKVAKDLFIILFFIYCSLSLAQLWFRALSAGVILYKVQNIIINLSGTIPASSQNSGRARKLVCLLYNITIIVLILHIAMYKIYAR